MKIADVVAGEHYASSTEGWKLDSRRRHRLLVQAVEAREVKRYTSWSRSDYDVQTRRGVLVVEVNEETGVPLPGHNPKWYEGARILEKLWADYEAELAALKPLEDRRHQLSGRLIAELDRLLGQEHYDLRSLARHHRGDVTFALHFEDEAAEKLIAALEADR